MKRVLACRFGQAILLVLTLAGCGSYLEKREAIGDGRDPDLARLRELTLAPYVAWTRETPPNCTSATLHEARGSVLMTAAMIDPAHDGLKAAYESEQWVLEVADGARTHDCARVARELYGKILSGNAGADFAVLRARAAAGIVDLSTRRPEIAIHER